MSCYISRSQKLLIPLVIQKLLRMLMCSSLMVGCISCPHPIQPECAPNEVLAYGIEDDICSIPICVSVHTPHSECQPMIRPTCSEGEQVIWMTDENGCQYGTCEALICPEHIPPICSLDEELVYFISDEGCHVAICERTQCAGTGCPDEPFINE